MRSQACSRQLYTMVVAPLESELTSLESQSSRAARRSNPALVADDALRYLPMAALYDGHRYMLEPLNNVLFTLRATVTWPMRRSRLAPLPTFWPWASQKLPAACPRFAASCRSSIPSSTILPFLTPTAPWKENCCHEQFTLAALKTQLGGGKSFFSGHIAAIC